MNNITSSISMLLLTGREITWNLLLVIFVLPLIETFIKPIFDYLKNVISTYYYKSDSLTVYSIDDVGYQNKYYTAIVYYLMDKMSNKNINMNQCNSYVTVTRSTNFRIPSYDISKSDVITDDDGTTFKFYSNRITSSEKGQSDASKCISYIILSGNNIDKLKKNLIKYMKFYLDNLDNLIGEDLDNPVIKLYTWDNFNKSWKINFSTIVPIFEKLFIKNNIKNDIINGIDKLLNDDKYYSKYPIARKISFLLHGAPGCGKTYLYLSLAHKYKLPVYLINKKLLETSADMISQIPEKSIIIFEEIDTFMISNRTKSSAKNNKKNDQDNLLAKMLELLDGYYSLPNKCIIFITTNYINKLDPAIIRKGRIDYNIEIKYPDMNIIKSIFDYYYEDDLIDLSRLNELSENVPTCEYTNIIMKNLSDSSKAIIELVELYNATKNAIVDKIEDVRVEEEEKDEDEDEDEDEKDDEEKDDDESEEDNKNSFNTSLMAKEIINMIVNPNSY